VGFLCCSVLRGTPMPEDGNRAFQKAKMLVA
jgi:hypothetical protein